MHPLTRLLIQVIYSTNFISGLYDKLTKYNLPYPEAIFELDYFRFRPKPFFEVAKELFYEGKYSPTIAHYFIKLLADYGKSQHAV